MQWLIEAEAKRNNSDKSIAARILLLNAAAIDTSSMVRRGSQSGYLVRTSC